MEGEVPSLRGRDGSLLPAKVRQDKAEVKAVGGGSGPQRKSTSVEDTRMGEQRPLANGADLAEGSNGLKREGEFVAGEKEGRISLEAIHLLIKRQNQRVLKPYPQR